MPLDPRCPAINGVGQLIQRVDDPQEAVGPLDMMERALRAAADDAGNPKLLESMDALFVPRGTWRYGNPAGLLAERVGASGARTALGAISGHIVQVLVDRAVQEIASGRAEIIGIVGGESENSKRRLLKQNLPVGWDDDVPGEADEHYGETKAAVFQHELDAGVNNAVKCFALCETSLRHSLGETPSAHRDRISELYSRMSAVAAANPYAWIQREVPADEIRNPSPENRMVGYPYTKLMTSNISVDQSAALILCSEAAAERFGLDKKKRVYLRAATEMSHSTHLSKRPVLHENPGQVIAGQRVLELAGTSPAELDHIDLYSCFPFAVQAGARALGIGLDPVPSLTGGMTFFGGPFGNYVLHSKATLVERLRAGSGGSGVIGSVGGFFAHFSYGIYSMEPGEAGFPIIEDVGEEFAKVPMRGYQAEFAGEAEIEAYTVEVGKEGPVQGIFTAFTDEGDRVWGRSQDLVLLDALLADEEACGRRARIESGILTLD